MSQHAVIDSNTTRRRAHELWQERGCPLGSSDRDWLQAEQELAAQLAPHAEASGQRAKTLSLVEASACVVAALPVPRPKRARSILMRTGPTAASLLLVALVPNPTRDETSHQPEQARVAPRR